MLFYTLKCYAKVRQVVDMEKIMEFRMAILVTVFLSMLVSADAKKEFIAATTVIVKTPADVSVNTDYWDMRIKTLCYVIRSRKMVRIIKKQIPVDVSKNCFGKLSISKLQKSLEVKQIEGTSIIIIKCYGQHRSIIHIANLVATLLVDYSKNNNDHLSNNVKTIIEDTSRKLAKYRELLTKLEEENPNVETESDSILLVMNRLRSEIQEVNISLITREINYNKIRALQKKKEIEFSDFDSLEPLIRKKEDLKIRTSELLAKYKENHPEVAKTKSHLVLVDRKLSRKIEAIAKREQELYHSSLKIRSQLNKMLSIQEQKFTTAKSHYARYLQYKQEIEVLRKRKDLLIKKLYQYQNAKPSIELSILEKAALTQGE